MADNTTPLNAELRSQLAKKLTDAKPARSDLIAGLVKAVQDVRTHEHPKWEDLYCLNLLTYMGERMAPVLRRLLDAEARVAELETSLAKYEVLNPQRCPAGKHADWLVDSEYGHACPWCRIDELQRRIAAEECCCPEPAPLCEGCRCRCHTAEGGGA